MGYAFNELKLSVASTKLSSTKDLYSIVNDHVDFLLGLLPTGTQHVETIWSTPRTLVTDFLICFEHPLFDSTIHKIEIDSVNVLWPNSAGIIQQESLFLKIRYLTPEGKDRF